MEENDSKNSIEKTTSPLSAAQFKRLIVRLKWSSNYEDWSHRIGCFLCVSISSALFFGLVACLTIQSAATLCVGVSCVLLNAIASILLGNIAKRQRHQAEQDIDRLVDFVQQVTDVRLLGDLLELCRMSWCLRPRPVGSHVQGMPADQRMPIDLQSPHPYFESKQSPFDRLVKACETAITRLIPFVQEADSERLNTRQREILRTPLLTSKYYKQGDRNPDTLAVLQALERIGDMRDLQDVQQLMDYPQEDIAVAAQRCSKAILERMEPLGDRNTLLRAGQADNKADVLLRPVKDTKDTQSAELLRAELGGGKDRNSL